MPPPVHAPPLDAGLAWLNTDRPLRLDHELRGRVVVLDFWTYCCINCMHILPDLAYLEHKYREEPVVFIGVHSAKFPNEASRHTIRQAILRYEIKHPVVIDDNMSIWRRYAVRSWPTLVMIDPTGRIAGAVAGEGNRDIIDTTIAELLATGRRDGTLAPAPLTLRPEAAVRAASGLAFPGKVLADADAGRLYVADSNHNRIVIADLPDAHGRSCVIRVVGSGAVGAQDGPADAATFNHPQGLAAGHGKLYVADTENHLIRAIDLESFDVDTIVGTGDMGADRAGGGMGMAQPINSPWDLTLEGATMYVAMAGTHQIWRIDLPVGFARALAGTGRENIVDGPTESAALAQPSGICILAGHIYFADSEVSAIRGIDLAAERVFTVIGEGLFAFGDVDGRHPEARLQHPLGVDAWGPALVVADTYNHKIKRIDPAERSVRTLVGTGRPDASTPDGQAGFFEPGGVSVSGDDAYVADTNNHRIVRINLTTRAWHEITFDGLDRLEASPRREPEGAAAPRDLADATGVAKHPPSRAASDTPNEKPIAAPAASVAAGEDIDVVIDMQGPDDMHVSPEAPWSLRVTAGGKTLVQRTATADTLPIRATIPKHAIVTETCWDVTASVVFCTEADRGVCVPCRRRWRLEVKKGGDHREIRLAAGVELEP